jgi:hypothetical protein
MSSAEPSYPTSMETSGRNSPDLLDDMDADENSGGDPLNEELQLALQNKLNQQQEAERTKKKQNAITRTLWGFIMIGGFIGMLPHGYVSLVHMETSFYSSLAHGPCISGRLGHAMSNVGLQRGYGPFLAEKYNTRSW